jgi:flagellar protein FliS
MHSSPSLEQVQSASPEDLVLMLFEGAVGFGRQAEQALAGGDREKGAALVGRVRAIVEELDRGLNPAAGSITRHLGAIYEYVLRRLDPDTVDAATVGEVIADLLVLCEAWSALVAERRAGSDSRDPAAALA